MDKVIFLLNSPYPFYTGGRETWIFNVANRLVNYYEVTIVAEDHFYKDNPSSRWEIDSRIKIINAKSLLSYKFTSWFLRSYFDYYHCFYRAFVMSRHVKREINNHQKTHIIALDTVFLPLAYRHLKNKNKLLNTIISSRGPHAEIYGSYWPRKKKKILRIESNNLLSADEIWSNGYDTQAQLLGKGFRSEVIINGVDCEHIQSCNMPEQEEIKKAKGIKVGTIGTLLDLKGYPTMIGALKIVKELDPSVRIDLFAYGKGNPEGYELLARKLGVEENVHFLGENKDAPLYVKQTDVLLALGTSEGSGMSMAALEMLASGVPVIATDIPCYQQLIEDGKNGYLISEGDSEELANKIIAVYKMNSEEKQKVSLEAQKRIRKNDWSQVVSFVMNSLEQR